MEKYVNELRIGNLVNYYPGLEPAHSNIKQPRFLAKISALFDGGAIQYEIIGKHPDAYHKSIEPIKLTEEWIREHTVCQEYCADGIDIDTYDSLIVLEGQYLIGHDKESDSWEFVRELTESFDNSTFLSAISAPMKYVHTLQNYFPAMSGSEMQIK